MTSICTHWYRMDGCYKASQMPVVDTRVTVPITGCASTCVVWLAAVETCFANNRSGSAQGTLPATPSPAPSPTIGGLLSHEAESARSGGNM